MPGQICKHIIDGNAEAAGVATGTMANLNMVEAKGVEPTAEEAKRLADAAETFCKTNRAVVQQWLARLPPEG